MKSDATQDFLHRAQLLAEQWRGLARSVEALLAEAWDSGIDVQAVRRALVSARRGTTKRRE